MVRFYHIFTVTAILSFSKCLAQVTFLTQPQDATVIEGGDATFQCAAEENGMALLFIWDFAPVGGSRMSVGTGTPVAGVSMVTVSGDRTQLTLSGVRREVDGATVVCVALGTTMDVDSNPATISVRISPVYSLLPNQPTSVLEGENFTYSFGFEANPTPTNFTWSRDGQVISSGGRIATSVSTISITSTTRSDSGVYEVVSYNEAGRGAGNFTLDVQYPPEYANTDSIQFTQLMVGAPFTLNCTPSAANPPVNTVSIEVDSSPVTSGDTVTVADNVLTIPSVQRSHSGNYSCNATNTRGSAVSYHNLLVVVPPGRPENLAFPSIGPYSVTVTWDPPSDDGGTPDPLNYMVALTTTSDGRTVSANQTTQIVLTFTALSHSENYTVSVVTVNSLSQQGPSAVGTVRTRDIPPVIGSVVTEVVSLSEVQVTVTLSDNGGQPVEEYTVEVRGTNHTFLSSEQVQVQVSLLVNQLRVNFTKGERVTLRAFAVNSVGTSDPVSADVIVPFPPNVTAPPTELRTTNIPVCCAGVQLNLAKPDDSSIKMWVLVDGTPHPPNQFNRNGSFLYIMGLQAGTEYSLNITLSNIFGTVWVNTTVRPLLGRPSTPQAALTPTAGGLTLQLTIMYPGTREDTLQYSISTSPSPLSRRQTGQQPLPVTNLTTPTSGSAEVALGPGTYSVTVTVTNQHGSTTSVPQEVTIPVSGGVDTAVIIGVVVTVATVILLIIIISAFITVLVCLKHKTTMSCCIKSGPSYNDVKVELKGVHSHFEDVKLEPNPAYGEVTPSQAQTEPQPDGEFIPIEGVTSDNVAMEENPAYQSVDTAVPQTEEPLYL